MTSNDGPIRGTIQLWVNRKKENHKARNKILYMGNFCVSYQQEKMEKTIGKNEITRITRKEDKKNGHLYKLYDR